MGKNSCENILFLLQLIGKALNILYYDCLKEFEMRGYSTVGSAIRSQRIGQGFESPYLHQKAPQGAFLRGNKGNDEFL